MTFAERLRVAVRYTFAVSGGHLSAFLSSLSMLGLVMAIALLIIVLSVMNGFDKEMRERILSLVPHITLYAELDSDEWEGRVDDITGFPGVRDVSPFVEFDTLLLRGRDIETARGIGLDTAHAGTGSRLLEYLTAEEAAQFLREPDSLVIGAGLARKLELVAGDSVTLIVPGRGGLGATAPTEFKRITLTAVLETGTELDQAIALVPLALASNLAGLDGGVSGYRVTAAELFEVRELAWNLLASLPPGFFSTNWMMTHGNLYAAIQLSRDLISILLFSIIAVAAFNVVSSLVLVVLNKRSNIAILLTLGAGARDVAWIFLLQGAMIGLVGVVVGSVLGVLGSLAVPAFVEGLESLLDLRFLSTDVYPVAFVPVDVLPSDVLLVTVTAFAMCILAAVYPARRASRLAPATVLNQDR